MPSGNALNVRNYNAQTGRPPAAVTINNCSTAPVFGENSGEGSFFRDFRGFWGFSFRESF